MFCSVYQSEHSFVARATRAWTDRPHSRSTAGGVRERSLLVLVRSVTDQERAGCAVLHPSRAGSRFLRRLTGADFLTGRLPIRNRPSRDTGEPSSADADTARAASRAQQRSAARKRIPPPVGPVARRLWNASLRRAPAALRSAPRVPGRQSRAWLSAFTAPPVPDPRQPEWCHRPSLRRRRIRDDFKRPCGPWGVLDTHKFVRVGLGKDLDIHSLSISDSALRVSCDAKQIVELAQVSILNQDSRFTHHFRGRQ